MGFPESQRAQPRPERRFASFCLKIGSQLFGNDAEKGQAELCCA